jgi:3-hydroxyisobutyrate dehydrogenase-like beta-hydroxyacid dehydrogenase
MSIQPTVGIISPGDMGHAIAGVLKEHGLRLITNLQGRSARSARLAAQAGIIDVADDATLVREADILLSILVPARAQELAERVAKAVQETHTSLLFADCNAIAPSTVKAIEQIVTAAGIDFVDAGIIGGPPRSGTKGPSLYVSGPHAAQFAQLKEFGLDIRVLGPHIGQASALKMCYASLTKGLTALATEAFTAAEAFGLTDTLSSALGTSQQGLLNWAERNVPAMPPKAYRWVGEMEEIARTYADLGLPPQIMAGAAAMYHFVEQTELGAETPEKRQKGQTLAEVTDILASTLKKEAF